MPTEPQPGGEPQHAGLHVRQLTKRYKGKRGGGTLANDAIDLSVAPGEVYGFLGPNGAGKTTLVKQIVGLLRPSAGTIHLDGVDLIAEPDRARELCAFLPQGSLPIDALTLSEAVELVGRIRGGSKKDVAARADQMLGELELDEWRGKKGHELSGGVRRLCGFVMAAVWPSRLLILDEPTNDVDPLRRRLLWRQIRRLGRGGTAVLLVTHNVLEAEQSVDRLAVIDGGKILASGTPAELKTPYRNRLRLELHLPAVALPGVSANTAAQSPGEPRTAQDKAAGAGSGETGAPALPDFVLRSTRRGNRANLYLAQHDASRAIEWAHAEVLAGRAEEYALSGASLEDVYLELIGRGDAASDKEAEEDGEDEEEW